MDDLLSTEPGKHKAHSPLFQKEIIAAPDEVDALGHVSNVVYLHWIMRVARAHSDAAGYTYPAYQKLGSVFVVKRHEIDYESSAYAGDRITLATWVESWKAASCIRKTSISRYTDGVILANASTRWVMVSMENFRPRRVPEELKAAFSGKLGG